MAMNEREIMLVSAAKNGNNRCFEELYELYYNKVFALARMTVKSESDAEDVLQQTFINAWQNLNMLTNPAGFSTWIQKITLNLCYSLLRRKNIAILMDAESDIENFGDEIPDTDFLPAIYAERDDLRVRLGKIIDGLSEVQKQTIIMYYYSELKVEEIAYVMECNVGTVKSRLFLARNAIRSEVEEQESKSGQKFYGVAGIPMLAFADLLTQQLETQGISSAVSANILSNISGTISQGALDAAQAVSHASSTAAGNVVGASQSAATVLTTGMSGAATVTGIPMAVKVVAGVIAAGIIISGGLLIWNTRDSVDSSPPDHTHISTPESNTRPSESDNDLPQENLPNETSPEPDTSVTDNDSVLFPDPLGYGTLILTDDDFWIVYETIPEFTALFDLFLSETGLQMEQIAFISEDISLFAYDPDPVRNFINSIDPQQFVYDNFPYRIHHTGNIGGHSAGPPARDNFRRITVRSSKVENLFELNEVITMVSVGLFAKGQLEVYRVASIDVTGSHIIWDTEQVAGALKVWDLDG
jgi:RNA polymerase sigma factor (sigma-70 family)